jgi:hypothetical protein|tara:strand:- start:4749 stop:5066 length:318 start_codon:yes stop_codon:yes gene_type:complete
MHCKDPLALARMSAGAPDFSGPGFSEARKIILIAPDISPDIPQAPDTGHAGSNEHHQELLKIADQLDDASEKHAGQAKRIRELCAKMMGKEEAPPDSTGEAMELE